MSHANLKGQIKDQQKTNPKKIEKKGIIKIKAEINEVVTVQIGSIMPRDRPIKQTKL